MPATRSQKVRLGVFVVVSSALLLTTIGVLAGISLWERRDAYYIEFSDLSLSGLEIGSPVKYNGVAVGRVEKIGMLPDDVTRTRVEISLDEGTPVKTDTKATVQFLGITGLKYLELEGGTKESERLAPGGRIGMGASLIGEITGKAQAIANKADLLMTNLLKVTDEENRTRLATLLEAAASLARTLDETVRQNRGDIQTVVANAKKLSVDLDLLVLEAHGVAADVRAVTGSPKFRASADALSDTLDLARRRLGDEELKPAIAQLRETAARMQTLFEHLDLTLLRSQENIYVTLEQFSETMENLNEFSRLIAENPSLLLRDSSREEKEIQ